MKKFIKYIIAFVFTCLSVICAIFYSTMKISKEIAEFKIEKQNKNLLMGNSHPECAFNDSLITNFENIAQSAQTNFYSYLKLKQILIQNEHIESVFIEYTNLSISKQMDNWTWGDSFLLEQLPVYLPFLNSSEIQLLYTNNSTGFSSATSKAFRYNMTNIILGRNNYKTGGYSSLSRSINDSLINSYESDKKKSYKDIDISQNNINYLHEIVKLCQDNGIKLYLIRSPQHKFMNRDNEDLLVQIKNNEFKNIEYLDFDKFPLRDTEFADFGHLNGKGAIIFSTWFNKIIERGLLTSSSKQEFINFEIENL